MLLAFYLKSILCIYMKVLEVGFHTRINLGGKEIPSLRQHEEMGSCYRCCSRSTSAMNVYSCLAFWVESSVFTVIWKYHSFTVFKSSRILSETSSSNILWITRSSYAPLLVVPTFCIGCVNSSGKKDNQFFIAVFILLRDLDFRSWYFSWFVYVQISHSIVFKT